MRILITGAAGFIGSHLCRKALSLNYKVIGIDNFDNFYPRKVKEHNISDLITSPDFKFIEFDITQNYSRLSRLLKNETIEIIIHLAAKTGVVNSISQSQDYLKTNIIGTDNILNLMKKTGCNKIIFGSSSSVYGNSENAIFSETDKADKPLNPYATSKRACELLTFNYHNIFNLDVINLRFFTVYGPAQRPDLAFHNFVSLITANKPITIFGNGNSKRDYTYVSDIVDGIINSIQFISERKNVFEIINLGNNNPISISEIVNNFYKLMNEQPNIIFEKERKGEMTSTCADISKAIKLLNYSPKVSINEGMKRFVDWYASQNND